MRRADVAWVEFEAGVVVVRLHDLAACPIILGASAAAIWEALDETEASADLVALIAERYDVEPDVVRDDVILWLEEAEQLGIVSVTA